MNKSAVNKLRRDETHPGNPTPLKSLEKVRKTFLNLYGEPVSFHIGPDGFGKFNLVISRNPKFRRDYNTTLFAQTIDNPLFWAEELMNHDE